MSLPTMADVLAELEMRFLSNLPESELNDAVRVFMQVEQAHWFYEDFFVDQHQHLKSMKMPVFAKTLFEQSQVLSTIADKCDVFYTKFKNYRHQIPVCGAILLNESYDKVLLVRSYQGKSWTFPRGKINEGEDEALCAAREVLEETGYQPPIDAAIHHRLETNDHGKKVILYVVPNTVEDQHFAPLARKEVSKIAWFPLNALPKGHYNVAPFMGRVKKIAATLRKQSKRLRNKKQCKNLSPNSRSGKKSRNHFGTEHTRDFDENNHDTFENALGGGVQGGAKKGWGIEEMFAANSKLTGLQYTYDGNAQTFGEEQCKAVRVGEDKQKSLWRAEGNEHVTASTSPRSSATASFSPSVAALFASAQEPAPLKLTSAPTKSTMAPAVAALFMSAPEPAPAATTALNPAVAALFASAAEPHAPPAPPAALQTCSAAAMQWKGGLLMPMTASK